MTRRVGQNPSLRIRKGANKTKSYFFQYWADQPGQEERIRKTEVIGLVSSMTKSEAERKKLEFISNLKINSSGYKIPSSRTFASAVKYYQEVFAPTNAERVHPECGELLHLELSLARLGQHSCRAHQH